MTIVVAVDRTDHGTPIVKEGHTLAEAFEDELRVVHVLSQSELRDIEEHNVEDTGHPAGQDEVKEIAAEIASDIASEVTDEFEAVGLIGEAAKRIVRYAETTDARYLVLGGRKRTPIGKAVFGSVTQSVLLNADCPVVTVLRREGSE
ncbi:universal stress protein [Halomarina halobia]|uniref:Universal stress protein n=1 Tax=Halomarina halobia TaxID=3033386 RepID=A0ABD6AFK0_9EURY|nr:universal stress protein [Halomarina sp. PSR21]